MTSKQSGLGEQNALAVDAQSCSTMSTPGTLPPRKFGAKVVRPKSLYSATNLASLAPRFGFSAETANLARESESK